MYNHNLIEEKWRRFWEENKTNQFVNDDSKPKYYALDMFPYPSGASLHIGHGRAYSLCDFYARYKLARGFNVLKPIGWDAFGLPSEQWAIANNKNPRLFNEINIATFREQLKLFGFYFDYDYEVDTSDPAFYKTTQWIFAKMYEHGLAVLEEVEVNWCEELMTVLANDEIEIKADGKMYSERGGFPVIKKPMKQWVLKITDYAEALDKDLDLVDWDDNFKLPQKKWIGVSKGVLIDFKTTTDHDIKVFTTRADTIYGVSYIAVSPENALALNLTTRELMEEVYRYIQETKTKSEVERKEEKTKTGVFTGNYAINPFNNKQIPIYITDYVINNYATGMVMGVPAHDQRDYDFAKAYGLEITKVIDNDVENEAYDGTGTYINSDILNGFTNQQDAIEKITNICKERKIGQYYTTTKLHDWTFSRQRYWGEPFPIIFDEKNKPHLLPYKDLPVVLPELDDYRADKDHPVPLSKAESWKHAVIDGKKYTRELQTMPGSAGSSWYFLAYILKNADGTYCEIDSKEGKERLDKWMPVDLYVGGTEHATGHVLYARFWHKFLHEIGIVKAPEPFIKLVDHGLILAPDGRKMSKRWGNTIQPNELAESHGADAFRVYIAFSGPINAVFPYSTTGMDGIRKWLDRVYNLFTTCEIKDSAEYITPHLDIAFNQFVKNATNNMEQLKHNVAISDMMVYINECYVDKIIYKEHMLGFLVILSCFAPHLAEELNNIVLNNNKSITKYSWPKYDESKLETDFINLPIQINGKLRATIQINKNLSEQEIIDIALSNDKVKNYTPNGYKKVIYIKNKILNIILP